MGGRQFPYNITGRQLIAKNFVGRADLYKISAGLSISRSLILQIKKLLDDSEDLTSQPRSG
jgi:hypothetical protein